MTAAVLGRHITPDTPPRPASTDAERQWAAIVASARAVPVVCDGTGTFDEHDEYPRVWACRGCQACQPTRKEAA